MVAIKGWRAYYAGGITFDSGEVRPEELPTGAYGIVEYLEPPYRVIVDGGDWYYMADGRWRASGTVWDEWIEAPDVVGAVIRSGPALPDEAWARMQAAMVADREWPQ